MQLLLLRSLLPPARAASHVSIVRRPTLIEIPPLFRLDLVSLSFSSPLAQPSILPRLFLHRLKKLTKRLDPD